MNSNSNSSGREVSAAYRRRCPAPLNKALGIMFGVLKKIFAPQPAKADFIDPSWGIMRFSVDEDMWETPFRLGDSQEAIIRISGESEPDPQLVAHAKDVAHDFALFEAKIRTFLSSEAHRFKGEEVIVSGLTVESLNLFWPARPNDGMVYFNSRPDDLRIWRCDYVGRQPEKLGYDS